MSNLRSLITLALAFLVPVLSQDAFAQSSLFNIPTAETLAKGDKYIEADFDAHFDSYRNGGWQSFGVLGVYGLNDRVEIGLNAYTVKAADGFEALELQPNFKVKAYQNERLGLTVSAGAIAYLSLNDRFGKDGTVSAYAIAGKSFKGDRSPRLTAGAYQLLGATPDSSDSRGLLLGVEQPVHKRVSLIADWNTGKNRFGYAATGIGITLSEKSYLYSAYYFGNEGRANNSFGVYYGLSF